MRRTASRGKVSTPIQLASSMSRCCLRRLLTRHSRARLTLFRTARSNLDQSAAARFIRHAIGGQAINRGAIVPSGAVGAVEPQHKRFDFEKEPPKPKDDGKARADEDSSDDDEHEEKDMEKAAGGSAKSKGKQKQGKRKSELGASAADAAHASSDNATSAGAKGKRRKIDPFEGECTAMPSLPTRKAVLCAHVNPPYTSICRERRRRIRAGPRRATQTGLGRAIGQRLAGLDAGWHGRWRCRYDEQEGKEESKEGREEGGACCERLSLRGKGRDIFLPLGCAFHSEPWPFIPLLYF